MYKKVIVFIATLLLFIRIINGQTFSTNDYEILRFVGYNANQPVLKNNEKILFKLVESSGRLSFLDSGNLQFFPEKYIGVTELQDNKIRYVETYKTPFKIILTTPAKTYLKKVDLDAEGISTNFATLNIYLGNQTDNPDRHESLPMHQLDLKSGDLKELSISGINPVVVGDYLFYADYPDPDQFDLVYDIYRVKIGDWQSPEKIFQDNYMNGWKVSADGKYLLAELIEYGHKPQKVIYSIKEKKYSPIDQKHLPSTVFYSKKKEAFCFYDIGLYSEGQRRFVYVNIPEFFPYQPVWSMDYGDTFITNYLLEEAGEDDLVKLDKSQLRLLINATFARKGWRFQSEDLADFFNQFNWYKAQLSRFSSNDDIKLTNADKYRSQLIRKIEERK